MGDPFWPDPSESPQRPGIKEAYLVSLILLSSPLIKRGGGGREAGTEAPKPFSFHRESERLHVGTKNLILFRGGVAKPIFIPKSAF